MSFFYWKFNNTVSVRHREIQNRINFTEKYYKIFSGNNYLATYLWN